MCHVQTFANVQIYAMYRDNVYDMGGGYVMYSENMCDMDMSCLVCTLPMYDM